LQAVVDALGDLRTPDGRPMVERVIRRADLPGGAHAAEGPDLHVVMDGYRYISCPLFATDGNVISKQIRGDSGSHRMHGALIAHGPQVRVGARVQGARIVDLAPTALYLLGCPIPDDMDGRVLDGILRPSVLANRAPEMEAVSVELARGAHVLSEEEEAELERRLKGLGRRGRAGASPQGVGLSWLRTEPPATRDRRREKRGCSCAARWCALRSWRSRSCLA